MIKILRTIWSTGIGPRSLVCCLAWVCFHNLCLLGWFRWMATWHASLMGICTGNGEYQKILRKEKFWQQVINILNGEASHGKAPAGLDFLNSLQFLPLRLTSQVLWQQISHPATPDLWNNSMKKISTKLTEFSRIRT